MEIRSDTRLLVMVLSVAVGCFAQHHAQQPESGRRAAVKPAFITEPEDVYVLPNSEAAMFCEAKFVSKLTFNCTGGLIPKQILSYQNEHNVTILMADVSHAMIKEASSLDGTVSCVCLATGYRDLKSRTALVMSSYLNQDFIISSLKKRVAKGSIVSLRCQPPTGVPSPNVSWQKDGFPVDTLSSRRVEVTNRANLSVVLIRKAQMSDAGEYCCIASNLAGTQKSASIKLIVYVDGGWSEWRKFSPCSAAKCGNGTRILKRICTNPAPENGGQICSGQNVKFEPCQDICPDLEIICPSDIYVYVNRSDDTPFKKVSWREPQVINRKNGTKFSVEVSPTWAVPPVNVNTSEAVYVITYVVTHAFGQSARCSFNLTVSNFSSSACSSQGCKHEVIPEEHAPTDVSTEEEKLGPIAIGLIVAMIVVLLLGSVALVSRFRKSRQSLEFVHVPQKECVLEIGDLELKKAATVASPLISHCDSYSLAASHSGKLRAGSPTVLEDLDFVPPLKELPKMAQNTQTEAVKHNEAEMAIDETHDKERDYRRTNSSASAKSTASDISRMVWNITNLPDNVDPKMVAWGLVDHNGGKFTIGETGVCLSVPPKAIPKGHTEGIFIAIMNQEKEHPQLSSKEALLSPVVKCGPNGLRFERPVILTIPHCALLEEAAWNMKVQYNESEPGTPADWKQLIDVNRQDGSEPCLALVEPNMVHLMVDHFTDFAVTGESAASSIETKKTVQIVAYVTPPEIDGDCLVRVYCVGDTPVHLESVHNQETERLGGITRDAPKPFHFRDRGGDLLVKLADHHQAWISSSGKQKKIRFQHIWEGIERMPSCTFVFTLVDESAPHFRATFDIKQECPDGDEQEVIVSTAVKQRQLKLGERSGSRSKATEHTCACAESANVPKAGSINSLEEIAGNVLSGTMAESPAASPLQLKHTSSGYFSFGFEPLPSTDSLTHRIRNELIIALDPPHPKADWRSLAEDLGYQMRHIRWFENLKPPASPTDILLTVMENQKIPLHKLAERLHELGRDDAAALIEAQLMLRETEV